MWAKRFYFVCGFLTLVVFFITPSHLIACPECGGWDRWFFYQERPYLKHFKRFPHKGQTIKIGPYRVFCNVIQISDRIIDLVIYADYPEGQRPYPGAKNLALYKYNDDATLKEVLRTVDPSIISRIRHIYREPDKYLLKVTLETDSQPLSGEMELFLGSPPPCYPYLVILGIVLLLVLGGSFYLQQKKKCLSSDITFSSTTGLRNF